VTADQTGEADRGIWARFRPPPAAAISRLDDHLRWRAGALPRAGDTLTDTGTDTLADAPTGRNVTIRWPDCWANGVRVTGGLVTRTSEMVAVRATGELPLKQEALLFDRIITDRPKAELLNRLNDIYPDGVKEYDAVAEFLEERGVLERVSIGDVVKDAVDQEDKLKNELLGEMMFASLSIFFKGLVTGPLMRVLEHIDKSQGSELQEKLQSNVSTWQPVSIHRLDFTDAYTRLCAMFLSSKYENITSLLYLPPKTVNTRKKDRLEHRRAFYDVVLSKFPIPSEQTPWEQIIEFRKDRDVQARYLALRRWINKAVRSNLSIAELSDELDYLTNRYEEYMRISRMEYRWKSLRTLLSIPVDWVIGGLTLNPRKLARPFELKERQIALLKAELKAPGREISYLVQAKENFGNVQGRENFGSELRRQETSRWSVKFTRGPTSQPRPKITSRRKWGDRSPPD
jgi:hypothetical protein